MLSGLYERIKDRGTISRWGGTAQVLVQKGYSPEFGARPMQRVLQDLVEEKVAQKLLRDRSRRVAPSRSQKLILVKLSYPSVNTGSLVKAAAPKGPRLYPLYIARLANRSGLTYNIYVCKQKYRNYRTSIGAHCAVAMLTLSNKEEATNPNIDGAPVDVCYQLNQMVVLATGPNLFQKLSRPNGNTNILSVLQCKGAKSSLTTWEKAKRKSPPVGGVHGGYSPSTLPNSPAN